MIPIPLLVGCRDRFDVTWRLVEWADRCPNVKTFLVDNASTFPPLLDYYQKTTATILRANANGGPRTPWRFVKQVLDGSRFFAITDCDLNMSDVPLDVFEICCELLDADQSLVKVGCALSLDGLPADHIAVAREAEYWDITKRQRKIVNGKVIECYSAPIDTTFAVYRVDGPAGVYGPALRLAGEYAARHEPWHYDPKSLPEDERYYLDHLCPSGLYYSPKVKALQS